MRPSRLILMAKSTVRPILVSLLALFSALSTNLAQSKEELDRENGFLASHFGDSLSEFGPSIANYKSRDNRVVIVTKKGEQPQWKGHKLKEKGGQVQVAYVYLDDTLVRIVAFMDPSTNYDTLLNFLTSQYGNNTHEGEGHDTGGRYLRRTSWITETVDLQCVYFRDRIWMDIHSEPLRAEYRRWREHNFDDEHKLWPLPDW